MCAAACVGSFGRSWNVSESCPTSKDIEGEMSNSTTLSLREPNSLSHGGIHVVVLNTALDLVCDMRSEVAAETTDQVEAAEFRLSEALLALFDLFDFYFHEKYGKGHRRSSNPVYSALWLLRYIAENCYSSQS